MAQPLMPKATAVWLIDNTTLTFKQIADFCGLHELEVKGIADGDVATGIKGMDPISAGQLMRAELEKAVADENYTMKLHKVSEDVPVPTRRKGPRYTPVSRRQDRPDAISWLVRNHPELTDAQVSRLVGTTKPTIQAIRDRTHWNSANIKPVDPVTLGLCSQIELDAEVQKAARRLEREAKKMGGAKLKSTEESLAETAQEPEAPAAEEITSENLFTNSETPAEPETKADDENIDVDSVFAGLKEKSDSE
ncbi:MAG: DUF1013 domain-containing protein [Alphaproteobacteria bacterium]|nr:MAG: DUF1013 domain-containing protein [Alphaproteobacteria bacterium]